MTVNPLYLARIRRLEEITFRAWPALDTANHAGWLQRFSNGYTKRANSINALEAISAVGPEAIDVLEAPYRARGLPPVWRITPLAPPAADGLLEARGYRRLEESLVQVAPLDGSPLDGSLVLDPAVTIASHPSPDWLAGFAELSPVRSWCRPPPGGAAWRDASCEASAPGATPRARALPISRSSTAMPPHARSMSSTASRRSTLTGIAYRPAHDPAGPDPRLLDPAPPRHP
jgi:hypothetical protein